MSATLQLECPANEPVRAYRAGEPQTLSLQSRLDEMAKEEVEIPCIVGGEPVYTDRVIEWTAPHDHSLRLCRWHAATPEVLAQAIQASQEAWKSWSRTPPEARLGIFRRAAELLSGPWRDTLNASTMLGQSKTCHEAEIDSACELADFWRFNPYFALRDVYSQQPYSPPGSQNYLDHRPLEGFVYAVTPFNFTCICGNLPTSPAMMGNVALWKPSESAMLSNYYIMKLLEEAGLPPGVINFVPGDPAEVTEVLLSSPHFAGLHFTGSTAVLRSIWQGIGQNLDRYRSYPRIVGESGGKDFVFAHETADLDALTTAVLRGAFEFQGQKCSAVSRLYVPRTLWKELEERLVFEMKTIKMGDVRDFRNFMGAVINRRAHDKIGYYLDYVRNTPGGKILQGGETSHEEGWFVQPTLVLCEDPRYKTMEEEIFGPVVSVYVYDDGKIDEALELCDTTSPYGLTGAVFARDRLVGQRLLGALRHAAGNLYLNDKPTGAIVNQQPFGGARASGTDDKAGSPLNLFRWVAPAAVKETFDPPTDYRYPFMEVGS